MQNLSKHYYLYNYRGHRLFCLIHNDIQQWWNEWLHSKWKRIQNQVDWCIKQLKSNLPPQTTTQSVFCTSFLLSAWHLKHASITCTRQIAQISHSTSQDLLNNNQELNHLCNVPVFLMSIVQLEFWNVEWIYYWKA